MDLFQLCHSKRGGELLFAFYCPEMTEGQLQADYSQQVALKHFDNDTKYHEMRNALKKSQMPRTSSREKWRLLTGDWVHRRHSTDAGYRQLCRDLIVTKRSPQIPSPKGILQMKSVGKLVRGARALFRYCGSRVSPFIFHGYSKKEALKALQPSCFPL